MLAPAFPTPPWTCLKIQAWTEPTRDELLSPQQEELMEEDTTLHHAEQSSSGTTAPAPASS